MTIFCFPDSEAQLQEITEHLKDAGLTDQYEEEAHGESVLLSIRTRSFDERELVKTILREAGIREPLYRNDPAA